MQAIRNKQEPTIKANSAYGLLPLTNGVDQDDHMYDYVHLSNSEATPEQLALGLGRDSAEHTNQLCNKDDQATEMVPDYDRTFATLNRRAPKFTPTQIEHLIAMLKNTHSSSQDTTGDGAHEESSGDSDTYLPLRPRSTSPQPYVEMIADERRSVHKDKGKTSETLPYKTYKSQSTYYVNYLAVCDRGREVSQGGVSKKGNGSERLQALQYVNFCDVVGGSTPKPTSSSLRCCRSYDCLSCATTRCPEKVSKPPMPAPKPPFISKPTNPYLQPVSGAHSNPRRDLSMFYL